MGKISMEGAFVACSMLCMSVLLSGCDFGTSQSRADCNGEACDCELSYYGMDAKIYLDGIPIEHASLHVTIPKVEPDTENSTGCCDAMYGLAPINYFHSRDDASNESAFCNTCSKSPNADVGNSAKQACKSGAAADVVLTSKSSVQKKRKTNLGDAPMDGSDKYFDCSIEFGTSEANAMLPANVLAAGASSRYNVKWTDKNDKSTKPCCSALKPVFQSVFVKGTAPADAEKQALCNACSSAYNTGLALTAYRWCANTSTLDVAQNLQSTEDSKSGMVV